MIESENARTQNTHTPTARGTRVLAQLVGIIETYFHFAWRVGAVGVLRR